MTRPLWPLTVLFLTLPVACSHGSGTPVRQADGGYMLSCKGPLSDCLRHAERVCRDAGYTVTEGRDVRDLLGHESGQSQVMIEKSDATVYCGSHSTRAPIELKRETPVEPVAPSVATPPVAAPVEAKPAPACVPGATQTCVGPGGCSGGQACKADGTGYDPCNCG
jgi:hypothetical protein